MAGIGDQTRWRGVQPTDPAVDIPVTLDGEELVIGMPSGAALIIDQHTKENGTVICVTISAGKTGYITSMQLGGYNLGYEIANVRLYLYDDTVTLIDEVIYTTLLPFENREVSVNPSPPLILPESYTLRLNSSQAGCLARSVILGYEV